MVGFEAFAKCILLANKVNTTNKIDSSYNIANTFHELKNRYYLCDKAIKIGEVTRLYSPAVESTSCWMVSFLLSN
jgi:ribosome biogenesis protein Tsr3